MADLAPAGAAEELDLAHRERGEVVMQHEVLPRLPLVLLDDLGVAAGAQGGRDQGLGLAAGEQGRAVGAGEEPDLDLDRPHPFTQSGNKEFNSCIWMPPSAERAGHILLADSTIFTTLFGGVDSLETFWKNLATIPLASGVRGKKTQAVA